ncbi:MAG: AI-2E family transporter [Blautia sp.]|nr:AI-2E family transporter [Blautia sp.]MDY4515714.1 AI-2E family transporter [Lachnospiraceae bacterium]
MTEKVKKILGITGITLAVYLSMKYLLPAVAPFFVAWILARWMYPLASRLEKRLPVNKGTITLVVLLLGTGAVVFAGWFLGAKLLTQIRSVIVHLEYYQGQVNDVARDCCRVAEHAFGIDGDQVMLFLEQNMERAQEYARSRAVPGIVHHSVAYAMGFLKAMGIFFLIFIAVLLIMKDYDAIRERLRNCRGYHRAIRILNRLWGLGGSYLRAQFVIMLIVIVICVLGLWMSGNPYALLAGILIGVLDVLPFIGTGTILVPWALLCLLRQDFFHAAAYFTLFLAANGVREYLEPRMIGDKMGVYPIVIALVVYGGMYLYGVSGVILGPLSLLVILECCREYVTVQSHADL